MFHVEHCRFGKTYLPVLVVGTEEPPDADALPGADAWPAVCPASAPMEGAPAGPSKAVEEAVGDGSEGVLQPAMTLIATAARHARNIMDGGKGIRVISDGVSATTVGTAAVSFSSWAEVTQAGQISRTAATILSALGRTAASRISL